MNRNKRTSRFWPCRPRSKITFAPLLLAVPPLVFRRWRSTWLWTVLFVASSAVLMLPAIGRFHDIAHWVESLFLGSGSYGSGAQTVIDPGAYSRALIQMGGDN